MEKNSVSIVRLKKTILVFLQMIPKSIEKIVKYCKRAYRGQKCVRSRRKKQKAYKKKENLISTHQNIKLYQKSNQIYFLCGFFQKKKQLSFLAALINFLKNIKQLHFTEDIVVGIYVSVCQFGHINPCSYLTSELRDYIKSVSIGLS